MAKPSSSKPSSPPLPDSPYRPRIKRSMIWHPGHCTRGFIVTDFYGDLNASIIEHGEVIKCCGQFWKANRQCTVGQDGTDDPEEPHPIYKRYRPSTINDIEVSTIARPLNRCQCQPSHSTTVPNLTTKSATSITSTSMATSTNRNNKPTLSPTLPSQRSQTPSQFPITSATYSPTEYIAPEGSYPRPQQPTVPLPSSSRSAYRDPVVALSSRLPLERTKGHVAEGVGSALGKFKRAKEKEGSKSPTFWGCIGEDGGKSPVGREVGCQHVFYCSHCGGKNSVWSDRRGSEGRE
ncbi:hypothetical protein AOL_s00215g467 [Orbilia oligospora ATCC 24927]|uniref:Uncharacterized protein n=1 Tax=Arthrobotrys oligospora (strain ATCC 24927 / CBS 115.81 / DSM 1491) TaxID=756982 RepID=G1XSW9_ARTOA|nr:hypothetical protein AOL_s00215g467 [Orbilia oligospora ATCC 24927]EGX43731.1 hypothetical protein AOL_s00215g467 [Orbilia oligospora ATCC 24927]